MKRIQSGRIVLTIRLRLRCGMTATPGGSYKPLTIVA